MSSTKFLAIVPQKVKPGDKIRIKGKILPDAEEFSINFANEKCHDPQDITYHFKWILPEDVIVENYKQNGDWIDHKESDYTTFDGRLTNDINKDSSSNKITLKNTNRITNGFQNVNDQDTVDYINSYSILGPTFALEFAFQDDGIYVYLVNDDGRNRITQFEPQFELTDIESVQVWGDVEKINELTFAYA